MFKSAIKFLLKDSAVYGIAGAVNKLMAVFTIPIIVRILTKEEYGVASTVMATAAFFVGFITLGVDSAVARWFFYSEDNDNEYRKKITSIGFFIQLTSLVFCMIAFFFLKDYIGQLLFNDNTELIYYWKIFMFSIPGTAFLLFSNNLFKWTFQRNKYLVITIGNSVTTVVLTLLFLIQFEMGIFGVILAPIISTNIFSLLGIYLGRHFLTNQNIFDLKLMKEMLVYGLPFAVIIIIVALLPSVDRLFLLRFVNMDLIGEYSVALKIAGLLYLVVNAFQISFGPYAYSIWHKPEAKKIFSDILVIYFALTVSMGVLLVCYGDLVISIFAGDKYLSSIRLLPVLLVGISVKSLSEFSLLGINYSKKTYFNILTSVTQFLALLLFNFILTEKFTFIGASTAILISNLIYILLTFYISNKYYKIEVDIIKLFALTSAAAFTYALILSGFLGYFKYILIIPYLFFVYRIVLDNNQRDEIFKNIKNRFKLS